VYTQVLKQLQGITLAPLTPQFWGEIARDFGFLPPFLWPFGLELGGWGGNAELQAVERKGTV
jgi:hypothetical protein